MIVLYSQRVRLNAIIKNRPWINDLRLKTATTNLIALVVPGMLVLTFFSFAFGQNGNVSQPSSRLATERLAEDSFRDALNLSSTKDRELARARLLNAVRLWESAREPVKAARACIQVGDSYRLAKKYQEALYYYNHALEVKSVSEQVKAVAFNSIALLYVELFQNDLALHNYALAENKARIANDISAQVLALTGQADVYHQQGETKKALACIEQARHLIGRLDDAQAEADLAYLEGQIEMETGLTEQARGGFEKALTRYRKSGNELGVVKTLCSISGLCLFKDQKQAALEHSQEAVDLAEKQGKLGITYTDKIRARDLRWRAWLSHARALRAVGQKDQAIASFKNSIFQLEGLFWSVDMTSEAGASAFREQCQVPYRELADLLIEQRKINEAYEWSHRARSRAMLSLLEGWRAKRLSKQEAHDNAPDEQSKTIASMRIQSLSSHNSLEQQTKLQKNIRDAEYALKEKRLKAEVGRASSRLAWSAPPNVKQLQEKLASEKRLMVEFLLGENRSFAWLISSKDISLEILPGKKEIEDSVRQFVELVSAAPDNLRIEREIAKLKGRAGKLFSTLFGPLSQQIAAGQKLIIVPDGLLYYLPFEALVRDGRFLVEDHEISYLPSAGMFNAEQESISRAEPKDKKELLAFGDPFFAPGTKISARRGAKSGLNYFARNMRSSRGYNLGPLPRTRDEVRSIATLFPGQQHQYLGKENTERALKREPLRQYKRLHFATHSVIDERSPSRSAIVFTLDDDPEEDGFLEVEEISELDLDCDLVVLSACQTGRGQLLSGEGVLGLSRAFFYAGARSVAVSLWNVSDISTGRLMKNFYQHLITNSGNAAALRQAKLQMMKSSPQTQHPFFWAPFIIIGKP